jgi:hypothetical protein
MECNLREELKLFLRHVIEVHTDKYGHLQVIDTDDENLIKNYYSGTIDGVVDSYLFNEKDEFSVAEIAKLTEMGWTVGKTKGFATNNNALMKVGDIAVTVHPFTTIKRRQYDLTWIEDVTEKVRAKHGDAGVEEYKIAYPNGYVKAKSFTEFHDLLAKIKEIQNKLA